MAGVICCWAWIDGLIDPSTDLLEQCQLPQDLLQHALLQDDALPQHLHGVPGAGLGGRLLDHGIDLSEAALSYRDGVHWSINTRQHHPPLKGRKQR